MKSMTLDSREDYDWADLGLHGDPFPIEAPAEVDYWADNKTLLEALTRTQVEAIVSRSSTIYAFYGRLGAGKTHAIRYFSNEKTQKTIREAIATRTRARTIVSVSTTAPVPRGTGELTEAIYQRVSSNLLTRLGVPELKQVLGFTQSTSETPPFHALHNLANKYALQTTIHPAKLASVMAKSEAWKYLLGERAKGFGVIENTGQMGEVISTLVKALVAEGSRVIIWIDELENLRNATARERWLFSDLVRKTFDESDRGLSIFLVFTFPTFEEVQELLLPAVWSRIGQRIVEFQPMKTEDDMVAFYDASVKQRGGVEPNSLAEPSAVRAIAKDLLKKAGEQGVTPRDFNLHMRSLLAAAIMLPRTKGKFRLTTTVLKNIEETERKVVKDLSDKLSGRLE